MRRRMRVPFWVAVATLCCLTGIAMAARPRAVRTGEGESPAPGHGGTRDDGGTSAERVSALTEQVRDMLTELETVSPPEAAGAQERTRQLLHERFLELEALIEQDPAGALASTLDDDTRARLVSAMPAANEDLETVGRFQGTADVLISDDFDKGVSVTIVTVEMGDRRVRVHFAGPMPDGLTSGTFLSVDGVLAGDRIAASSGEILAGVEVSAACSTTGDQATVVLLVNLPNYTLPSFLTHEYVRNFMFGDDGGRSLDGYWSEASYGLASASGDVFGPYTLGQNYTCGQFNDQSAAIRSAAILAADADVDFRNYNRIFILFPPPAPCRYAGLGTVGCGQSSTPGDGTFSASTSWLPSDVFESFFDARFWGVFVASHEGGHNLGLNHAYLRSFGSETLSVPGSPWSDSEYTDPYSAMGRPRFGHYAAPQKLLLGWLDPAINVQTVTTSGIYPLLPYEPPADGVQVLRLQRGSESEWLWIESRTNQSSYDCVQAPQLGDLACDGALIHYDAGFNSSSFLLDFTPGSPSFVNDAPLPTGTTWFDRYTGLSLTPSYGTGALNLTATYGARTCHRPPGVQVTPAGQTVNNGAAVSFTVTVTNMDEPSCPNGTYQLGSSPIGWGGVFGQSSLNIPPGEARSTPLGMTVPRSTEAGSHEVMVSATWTTVSGTGTQTVNVISDCILGDPLVRVLPDTQSVAINEPATFTVEIDSTDTPGCGIHRFDVSSAMPVGWSGSISPFFINLAGNHPPGTVQLTKFIPAGTPIGSSHTVDATVTSRPGTPPAVPHVGSDTAELTVAAPCVHAAPTVTSTPMAAAAAPGEDVTYLGHVRNNDSPTCQTVTFTLDVSGPLGWPVFPVSDCIPPCPPILPVAPGQSGDVWFGSTVPPGTQAGAYSISLTADSGSHSGAVQVTAGVEPVCISQDPTVVLTPASTQRNAGQPASFTATVTNNDVGSTCTPAPFALSAAVPAGWSSSLASSVTVAPGASVPVPFIATSPLTAASGSYGVSVTATNGGRSGTGGAIVQVSAVCIQGSGPVVTLSPDARNVAAGQTASFLVTLVDNDVGAACTGYNVTLETTQPAGFGHSIVPPALFVPPGGTVSATFHATPSVTHAGGDHFVTVTAVRGNTIGDDSTGSAIVRVQPLRTLEAGYAHSVSRHSDGTVWAWGLNTSGQLGDSTLTSRNAPVRSGSLTDALEVGAGVFHTVALKSDGTVWAWGGNADGQLGDGTTALRNSPGQVPGLTGIVAIASGFSHTIALKSDGTVWTWGDNWGGQIGDGTTNDRLSPFQVAGLSGVAAVAAGAFHSLVVMSDGTVWTWGRNAEGELGDGTHTDRYTPGPIPGLGGVTRADCGAYFNIVVLVDGTMKGWGHNFFGQLGDGTTLERTTPVGVSVMTGVVRIAAGSAFSLALRNDGTLWSFGQNVFGQLGDGTTTHRSIPQQIAGLASIVAVAAGEDHSLARNAAGLIYGWGKNQDGQIGAGPSPQTTPIVITDDQQRPWLAMTVDATPQVTGEFASISIDPWGRTGIAYVDRTNGDLKFALRVGTGWSIETVDAVNSTGWYTSLAFGADGSPRISYMDGTRTYLRYAYKSGGAWIREDVANTNCTLPTSLAFDTADRPFIAIQDCASTRVRVFAKSGTWSQIRSQQGASPSLRMHGNLPRISYFLHNVNPTQLRYLSASGTLGSFTWTDEAVPGGGGANASSIAVDSLGNPRISFYAANTRSLRMAKKLGGAWSVETVDATPGDVGNWNSIALDASSRPRISYLASGFVKHAEWSGSAWQLDFVDASGDTPAATALAVDAAGNSRIAYFDTPNGDLRYAISQPDVTAPAPPSLSIDAGRTTIAVSWTAPGDDGSSGTASAYDLRRSLSPIDDLSFSQAVIVPMGPPGPAGAQECVDFQSLPSCTTHYFALRVLDDLGNQSPLAVGQMVTDCSGSQELVCF